MKVNIRPASIDDAKSVAPLMLSASDEVYQFWLATNTHTALAAFTSAVANNAGVKGYAKQHIAEIHPETIDVKVLDAKVLDVETTEANTIDAGRLGTEIVGVVGAYLGSDVLRLEALFTKWLLGFYPLKEWYQVVSRGLRLAKLVSGIPKNMLYVANMAVRADMQGKGIATQLLQSQYALAKRLGCAELGLDVSVTNVNAQRLYQHFGFEIVHESHYSDASVNVPNQLRMVMTL